MTARPAFPDRYLVDKVGTPDPQASQYVVLDVIHDFEARVALQKLAREYRRSGQPHQADLLTAYLHSTSAAHGEAVRKRNALLGKDKKTSSNQHA